MNTIQERLQYALELREMSQAELARKSGVTRAAISNVVNGISKNFSADVALKVARVLQVDPYWLILGEGRPIKDTFQDDYPEVASILNEMNPDSKHLAIEVLRRFQK